MGDIGRKKKYWDLEPLPDEVPEEPPVQAPEAEPVPA